MLDWFKKQIEAQRDRAIEQVGRYEGRKDAFNDVLSLLNPQVTCQQCGTGFWRGNNGSQERDAEIAKHNADRHPVETVD